MTNLYLKKATCQAFVSGLITFLFSTLLVWTNGAPVLAFFLLLGPGFIYGACVGQHLGIPQNPGLFILASFAIYLPCFVWVTSDHVQVTPLKLVSASVIGAILLLTSYRLLIKQNNFFIKSLIQISLAALVGTIPAIISAYLIDKKLVDRDWTGALMTVILSVFPLWQVAVTWVLAKDAALLIDDKNEINPR